MKNEKDQTSKKSSNKNLDDKNSKLHFVLYTDGSYWPANNETGYYGSGVHAYAYRDEAKSNSDKPSDWNITKQGYQSSAHKLEGNQQVYPEIYLDLAFSYANQGSAPQAEVSAVIDGLRYLLTLEQSFEIHDVIIHIDAQYALEQLEKALEGQDENINQQLLEVVKSYQEQKIKIIPKKIKAHSGELGNEIADRLAYYARSQSCIHNVGEWCNIYSGKKYWTREYIRHPMLRYKQLFFTNNLYADKNEVVYSIMDYPTTSEPGRKTHEACFGIVILHEPVDIIKDSIMNYFKLALKLGSYSVVNTLNLNNLFHRNTFHWYDLFKDNIFNFDMKKRVLRNLLQEPLIHNILPSGLAKQAMDKMQVLYNIKTDYIKFKNNESHHFTFIDITDKFYKIEKNKKEEEVYNTILENGTNNIKFEVKYKELTLPVYFDLGKDTLSRNQFKQLEKSKPKVYLVLQQVAEKIFNYYTVVDTIEHDIGVFCNFYSGKIYLLDDKKKK